MSSQRPASAGELCTCGRPAVTVFVSEEWGETGYCGIEGGKPEICPFCGSDQCVGRCPEYRVRPADEGQADEHDPGAAADRAYDAEVDRANGVV
jgi:hypothetical protein